MTPVSPGWGVGVVVSVLLGVGLVQARAGWFGWVVGCRLYVENFTVDASILSLWSSF